MTPQSQQSGGELEDGRDSEAPALQAAFEWLVCWAVALAFPIGIIVAAAEALDMAFPQGRAGVHALIALAAGLVAGIAISAWGGSMKGKRVARQTQRIVHRYALLLALTVGSLAGWHWGSQYIPDEMRANAERAAWRTCAKMPECVAQATVANDDHEVELYISPPNSPNVQRRLLSDPLR